MAEAYYIIERKDLGGVMSKDCKDMKNIENKAILDATPPLIQGGGGSVIH